jgi:hypothetical protein
MEPGKDLAGDKARVRGPRGFFLALLLSFLSLGAVTLSLTSLSGLGHWTFWQFVGLFGIIEFAVGLAAIIAPNVWRLPVAQVQTTQTTDVELTASTTFIPHWSGAGRALAGLVMIVAAGANASVALSSLALVPFLLALALCVFEVSTLFAYAGVVHTNFDVIQIAILRAGKETRLPALSIGASVLHLLISMAAIPIVKFVSPSVLFGPEMRIGMGSLGLSLASAFLLGVAAFLVWRRRISWQATPAQQVEAERFA